MASDRHDGKPAPATRPESRDDAARSVYGPRPLSALLPALVRPAFRGRAAATAQVVADWAAIVGPAYAALTTPQRLASGTLTIGCAGPVAMELQHVAPALMERVNAHLGRVIVERLRFVQTAPARQPARLPAAPKPALQAAHDAVAGLPPGALRDALERLGQAVLARRP
jgi:hypothetical protein